ncbi:hypothetical protein BDD12DRAFT_890433 [Trichophaea hybrida]|nr:hypothetical protein BDD12DRAFT_890433 [Trichophaea hybrida]
MRLKSEIFSELGAASGLFRGIKGCLHPYSISSQPESKSSSHNPASKTRVSAANAHSSQSLTVPGPHPSDLASRPPPKTKRPQTVATECRTDSVYGVRRNHTPGKAGRESGVGLTWEAKAMHSTGPSGLEVKGLEAWQGRLAPLVLQASVLLNGYRSLETEGTGHSNKEGVIDTEDEEGEKCCAATAHNMASTVQRFNG